MKNTKSTQLDTRRCIIVTDLLELDIRRGKIQSGRPFLNRAEICERYGISPVTAHKVQRALAERGLIVSRNGRPFMVCDPERLGVVPLRKVRLLRQVPSEQVDRVMDAIAAGARKACGRHGLEFQEEFIELLDKDSRKLNAIGDCEEGQAVILHPYKEMMLRAASYFLKYWFRRVTIDNPLPDTPGVMVDSLDGLMALFGEARRRGVKSMLLLPSASTWQNIYISERLHLAQRLAPTFGIDLKANLTVNFDDIVAQIRRERPEAILMLYDDGMEALQESLAVALPSLPSFYVFARNMVPRPQCIAYETDYRQLGEAAVEELLAHPIRTSHVFLRFVPGKLKTPTQEEEK